VNCTEEGPSCADEGDRYCRANDMDGMADMLNELELVDLRLAFMGN